MTTPATSDFVVSITGELPATVTVSLTFWSFIEKSLVNDSPIVIVMFRVSVVAKP